MRRLQKSGSAAPAAPWEEACDALRHCGQRTSFLPLEATRVASTATNGSDIVSDERRSGGAGGSSGPRREAARPPRERAEADARRQRTLGARVAHMHRRREQRGDGRCCSARGGNDAERRSLTWRRPLGSRPQCSPSAPHLCCSAARARSVAVPAPRPQPRCCAPISSPCVHEMRKPAARAPAARRSAPSSTSDGCASLRSTGRSARQLHRELSPSLSEEEEEEFDELEFLAVAMAGLATVLVCALAMHAARPVRRSY